MRHKYFKGFNWGKAQSKKSSGPYKREVDLVNDPMQHFYDKGEDKLRKRNFYEGRVIPCEYN